MKSNSNFSQLMYEKYNLCKNTKVHLLLKNGERLTGFLIACYHDDAGEVLAWDFIEDKYVKYENEINIFTSEDDVRIDQKTIAEVFFFEDKTVIKF